MLLLLNRCYPEEFNFENLNKFVNLHYKQKMKSKKSNKDQNQNSDSNKANKKERKKDKPIAISARKSLLYENYEVYHPDGELMFKCQKKKFEWYLEKGLAEKISDNPPKIRLTFNPKGHGQGKEYSLDNNDNKCCVCGKTYDYIRHSIVPHFYRHFFPENMKSHYSHDVVLMCV